MTDVNLVKAEVNKHNKNVRDDLTNRINRIKSQNDSATKRIIDYIIQVFSSIAGVKGKSTVYVMIDDLSFEKYDIERKVRLKYIRLGLRSKGFRCFKTGKDSFLLSCELERCKLFKLRIIQILICLFGHNPDIFVKGKHIIY